MEILQNFVAFSEYMNFTSYGSVKTILSFLPKLPTLDCYEFCSVTNLQIWRAGVHPTLCNVFILQYHKLFCSDNYLVLLSDLPEFDSGLDP